MGSGRHGQPIRKRAILIFRLFGHWPPFGHGWPRLGPLGCGRCFQGLAGQTAREAIVGHSDPRQRPGETGGRDVFTNGQFE